MMQQIPRHKVFISYHHDSDQRYKDYFASMMRGDIVDKSVQDDDIDDENLKVDAIRQRIRDEFIRDATVTVVLIGPSTWQRKHVDWEIGASLRETKANSRCGLLGILLPNHFDANRRKYNLRRIPPRLTDNATGNEPFAEIQRWSTNADTVRRWIHEAFLRRDGTPPRNNRVHYSKNCSGDPIAGWPN